MKSFSINKEALKKIQSILDRNYYSDQVAVLVDISDPSQMLDGVKNAFLHGSDQDKLIPIARKRYKAIKDQLSFHLIVVVYENKNISPKNLIKINGVTFAMCASDREALRGFCLIYENECFLLRNGNSVFSSLQSVFNNQSGRSNE